MSEQLKIQGIAVEELASTYGTPLYLYDGDALASQYRTLRGFLCPDVEMFFSLKANPNVSICAALAALGARAEVSSLTELRTALWAGMDPRDIIFLGPGKSVDELGECLDRQVYAIVCESLDELAVIDSLAATRGVIARVMLRVNPSFSVKRSGLAMGGKPRQFGIDERALLEHRDLAERMPSVALVGVHVYMGTRILSEDVVAENTERILDLAERISTELGFPLEVVDIGGGLGVAYFDGERDLDPQLVAAAVNKSAVPFRERFPDTRLIMELGRYLAAPAGMYVIRVRSVKTSFGERFAVADGGTHHHMAAVGIGSFVKRNFPISKVAGDSGAVLEPWHITGPLCTPNDTLGKNVLIPPLGPGDLIAVGRSGAYGPTASPVHFLSHGAPAEVLVAAGRAHLIRRRDQVEDLLEKQSLYTDADAPTTSSASSSTVLPTIQEKG